jgi:hypothetical protein
MTTAEFILQVVQADGPCSIKHVLHDCKQQGFTKGFIPALQSLKNARLVETDSEDGDTIISLI